MSTIPLETTLARLTTPGVGARLMRHSRDALQHTVATLREWHRRSRDRAALASFDDRMLRDIGVTRVDALYEINKPFWRQ
jgi:uncharacterized protein YjiS (DUF1127 family)